MGGAFRWLASYLIWGKLVLDMGEVRLAECNHQMSSFTLSEIEILLEENRNVFNIRQRPICECPRRCLPPQTCIYERGLFGRHRSALNNDGEQNLP